jgi:hypothetical protein
MSNQAKTPDPAPQGDLTRLRLHRGGDELASLDGRLVERINALRAFLGKTPDWQPAAAPRPAIAEVQPAAVTDHRPSGRLAVTEVGGESLADIDRCLNDRINAMRAYLGKSTDWQPSGRAAEAAPRRRYGA